jgi:hypothetical protein
MTRRHSAVLISAGRLLRHRAARAAPERHLCVYERLSAGCLSRSCPESWGLVAPSVDFGRLHGCANPSEDHESSGATPVCRLGRAALITRRSQVQILPPQLWFPATRTVPPSLNRRPASTCPDTMNTRPLPRCSGPLAPWATTAWYAVQAMEKAGLPEIAVVDGQGAIAGTRRRAPQPPALSRDRASGRGCRASQARLPLPS